MFFLQSYLFFRVPLWKPDKFISDTVNFVKSAFNKWILTALCFLAACGYILLIVNWHKFETTIAESLNYAGLIKYSISIIFLKVIHEFAHAYTAKNAGIRIRRMGIGFIVFFPRLYTDITDTWRVRDKKTKVLIDSAGIISELIIGGIAVIFWVYSEPGILKTLSYYIFAVSSINTVLINGNPFIRYDGYYILMDIVGIDNLYQRSRLLVSKLIREKLFGIKTIIPFDLSNVQKNLIVIFGISSFIYRIFLYTGIILIVYYKFTKIVGIFLASLEVYLLIARPCYLECKVILKNTQKGQRKNAKIAAISALILFILFFLPFPWTISLPCVIGSNNNNIIYIQTSGFLKKIDSENGNTVKKDQILFLLDNPQLENELYIQKKNLQIKETELDQLKSITEQRFQESLKTKIQQINQIKNNIEELERKLSDLEIKSSIEGTFVLFNWRMKPGKWLDFGEPVGEVFSDKDLMIYAYAEEKYAQVISVGEKVNIFLNDNIKCYKGEVVRINSVPTKEWGPSPLLDTSKGPLPVLKRENYSSYILKNYYYQIVIKPLTNPDGNFKFSRTGTVQTREFSSVGLNFMRSIINVVLRELSF